MNLSLRILVTVGGTAAWLGLAIAGWGGFSGFFAHKALDALVVVGAATALFAACAGGNLSSGIKEDRGNRWVLPAFTVIGLLLGYIPAWTDRHDIASLDGETLRWFGVILGAAGGGLRIWPVYVLGDRFSGLVAIQPGHTLVTTGIYRHIRNPSYLGLLLNTVGWSLAFRSIVGLALIAALVPPLIARMNAEERLLREQFGSEYEAYRAHTWRLLPGVY